MRRLTARAAGTPGYRVDGGTISPEAGAGGFVGEAIDRLGAFETLWEDLLRRQREISDRLDALRRDGREKTCEFRQLFAEKLQNSQILSLFELYGLR